MLTAIGTTHTYRKYIRITYFNSGTRRAAKAALRCEQLLRQEMPELIHVRSIHTYISIHKVGLHRNSSQYMELEDSPASSQVCTAPARTAILSRGHGTERLLADESPQLRRNYGIIQPVRFCPEYGLLRAYLIL